MKLLASVLVAAMVWLPGVVVGQERPNILVLMAEDLSARVGAFGDPVARTPNLDRLAAGGVRFPNTFTTAGVCAPSRAAFITGVHQVTLGAQHMRTSDANVASYLAVPPAIRRDDQNRVALTADAGASIEYRLNDGRWRLYTEPVTTAAQDEITARAVRYGYAVSAEASPEPAGS